jgi:type IV pilus assembly protein PilX
MKTPSCKPFESQRGITLVIALLFLIVLTLLGVSATIGTTLEERMARNSRDYNIAFQASEAALRDARKEIVGQSLRSPPIFGATGFAADCGTGAYQGLCLPATTGSDVWDTYMGSKGVDYGTNAVIAFGSTTTTPPLPLSTEPGGVAQQPRYLIEAIPDLSVGVSLKAGATKYIYRSTTQGFGPTVNTQVILQETVRP